MVDEGVAISADLLIVCSHGFFIHIDLPAHAPQTIFQDIVPRVDPRDEHEVGHHDACDFIFC